MIIFIKAFDRAASPRLYDIEALWELENPQVRKEIEEKLA